MTRRNARRGLVAFAAIVAVVYGGLIAFFRLTEKQMVFEPEQGTGHTVMPLPDSLHLEMSRVQLTTTDGARISGIVIPAPDSGAQWLLYLHGKAGNVTSWDRPVFYARWHALGLNILAIDYRGYGESEARMPDEAGTYTDARCAYDWLRTVRHVPADHIVIYGHSLGAAIATDLALYVEAAGLVLEGGFTSIPDVGAERYPWLPVRLLATQRFASIEKIGRVAMPKLIMHASDDSIVPYAMGQQLFAAARAPKEWVELKGGHMRAFLSDSAHFWGHAGAFVQRLRSDLPAGESPAPSTPARP